MSNRPSLEQLDAAMDLLFELGSRYGEYGVSPQARISFEYGGWAGGLGWSQPGTAIVRVCVGELKLEAIGDSYSEAAYALWCKLLDSFGTRFLLGDKDWVGQAKTVIDCKLLETNEPDEADRSRDIMNDEPLNPEAKAVRERAQAARKDIEEAIHIVGRRPFVIDEQGKTLDIAAQKVLDALEAADDQG